jgi:beta-carotene 3-hydroxylase
MITTTTTAVLAVLGCALVVAALMEPYSALVHRVLWHGPLWRVHRHHHRRTSRRGLGPNDALSASHAPIAIGLCVAALVLRDDVASVLMLGAGLGMSAYGLLYMLFHDGMVHGRLPVSFLLRFRVCRAWRDAHEEHHRGPRARGPWGFFLSPFMHARAPRASSSRTHARAVARAATEGAAVGER